MIMKDAFSACHPAVNLVFFIGTIGCGVVFLHPVYLSVSICCSLCYYIFLKRKKAIKATACMLPLVIFLSAVNPLFNTQGETVLFLITDRPYTLEALLYGCALSGMLLTMLLWFGCYNHVLTGDKLTSLIGNLLPSLSLLLVMVLRMIPDLIQKIHQITGSRRSVGKGSDRKLQEGMTVLGALVSWALEGSVTKADSMRARGYGTAKRQSFLIYRMTLRDYTLLFMELTLLTGILIGASCGHANTIYAPVISFSPPSWGVVLYGIYLSIPLALNIKEAIQWHISKSKI